MPARYPDRELPSDTRRDAQRARAARSAQPLTPPPDFGSAHYGGNPPPAARRAGSGAYGNGMTYGPPVQGGVRRDTGLPPRYVPGAAPTYGPAPQRAKATRQPQRDNGRYPGAQDARAQPGGHARRTDPSLYEWDRLSPEQQQAVMQTIGSAGQTKAFLPRNVVLIAAVLVGLLAIAALALLLLR